MKIHHKMSHGESIAMETAACRHCGSEFEFYPSEKDGVYCEECVKSEEVIWGWPDIDQSGEKNPMYGTGKDLIDTECTQCGKPLKRYKVLEGKARLCSDECRSEWMSGENNPRFNPDYDRRSIYTPKYFRKRREVLRRDEESCQNCGKEKEECSFLDTHHIDKITSFDNPDDSHTLENMISLCRSCHRLLENSPDKCRQLI